MHNCRTCSKSHRYWDNQKSVRWNDRTQLNLKRPDSQVLANKLRYSVLKHIDSMTQNQNPLPLGVGRTYTPLAVNTECFMAKQYSILEMFEGDEMDQKLAQLSLDDLESIVSQECKDISCALTMARKNNIDVSHSKHTEGEVRTMCRHETGSIIMRVCDTDEDISADVVAKMLHLAEIKSALTAPPQVIYNLLFDDEEIEPLPVNTAAYESLLSDVVVPLGPPADLKTDLDLADVARLNTSAELTDDSFQNNETIDEFRELQSDLIGKLFDHSDVNYKAPNLEELLHGIQEEVPRDLSATLSSFEFLIEPQDSKCRSLYQLRGSAPPSWFPDYHALFPDSPFGKFEKTNNPMEVLERAWEHVQPSGMKPSEGIQLIGL